MNGDKDSAELAKRENELKEKALRNKVVRTRKSSGPGSGSGSMSASGSGESPPTP